MFPKRNYDLFAADGLTEKQISFPHTRLEHLRSMFNNHHVKFTADEVSLSVSAYLNCSFISYDELY